MCGEEKLQKRCERFLYRFPRYFSCELKDMTSTVKDFFLEVATHDRHQLRLHAYFCILAIQFFHTICCLSNSVCFVKDGAREITAL